MHLVDWRQLRILGAVVAIALILGLIAACGDGGSANRDQASAFATAQAEAEAVPQPDPEPNPEPDPDPEAEAAPGVVEAPPEGAAEVTVELREWSISPEPAQVAAGAVYFLAQNVGSEPHELVVIRSDEAPEALPVEDGKVPEDEVDFIGEIEAFAAGSEASGVFELVPGSYVLLCNIVEQEESGELESHYEKGMYARFTVH